MARRAPQSKAASPTVEPAGTESGVVETSPGDPVSSGLAPTELSAADAAPTPPSAELAQRIWRRNHEVLAVTEPGIYTGEDRKFGQVYIAFDKERPTDEQKAKMTEAGFRYRAAEKRWDIEATPVTRVAAKKLVAEFTGVLLGAAQGR